jgi:hypothetical protein
VCHEPGKVSNVDFENPKLLVQFGFARGPCISELQRACQVPQGDSFEIPRTSGVYLIVRNGSAPVRFSRASRGGRFKGRNPALPAAILKQRWVQGAKVLYIGKAGVPGQRATLRSRLQAYMRFGLGEPCAHWGGRCIWQLRDAKNLLVYWKPSRRQIPRQVEKKLLEAFVQRYGRRPFANLTG